MGLDSALTEQSHTVGVNHRQNAIRMASLPPMMGDLLEYFEARSRSLDNMEAMSKSNCPLESKYTSCIRFNGVPILPPVMTTRRKEEMQTYRRQAMKRENTRKSRHREQLVAKVQSIVAEVEERRSQRPSRSGASSPAGSDTSSSSRLSTARTRIAYARTSPTPQRMVQGRISPSPVSYGNRERVKPTATKTNTSKDTKHAQLGKPAKSNLLNVTSKIKSKSEQDISKMSEWTVVDQKSAAQNSKIKTAKYDHNNVVRKGGKPQVDKTGTTDKKLGQNSTLNNLKRASSMSSLPNPAKIQGIPVPKPPTSPMSRKQQRRAMLGMSGQFSMSNPDLRTIDKSDSETSRSEESPSHRRKKLHKSSQQSVSDPDITTIGLDSERKKTTSPHNLPLKESKTSGVTKNEQKSTTKKQNDVSSVSSEGKHLNANAEETARHIGNQSANVGANEREGQLDSLTDFPSLEQCNSLPQEFGGMPLSSVRQQQISHVLSKLSKCLNIQDTLSTMGSTGSTETNQLNTQQEEKAGASKKSSSYRQRPQVGISVTSVQSERDSVSGSNPVFSDASSSSYVQTPSSNNSSGLSSGPSSSGAGNTSYGSSSSTSAVSTQHQRRMSPKGGKSKVHFASFLTEISTSASQSLEGRISVRKMDITPQNSPHVSLDVSDGAGKEDSVDGKLSLQIPPKNLYDLGSSHRPQGSNTESMLSKVALSPEESDSPTTPGELFNADNGLPFHGYGMEVENNTSDKENEYHDGQRVISSSGFIESGKNTTSGIQSGNGMKDCRIQSVKSSTKSLNSDDGSQCSTLKSSQDLLKKETATDAKSSVEHDSKLITEEQPVFTSDTEYTSQKQQFSAKLYNQSRVSKQTGTEKQRNSDEQNDASKDEEKAAKSVFKPGHARKGSYTVQQPSPVLLQAVSQDFTASNGIVTGNSSRPVQRKLDMDKATIGMQNQITQENISLHSSTEEEGKAEHIQRYLNHVQNHSGGKAVVPSAPKNLSAKMNDIPPPIDISDAIQSFTASLQTLEDMSEDELLKIQTDHFNRLRNVLIQQQKQQLEELFVQQRREQLKLQDEISSFQQQIKDSQDLSLEHSPENNLAYSTEEPEKLNASHIHPPYPGQVDQQDFAYMASPSLYFNPRDRENNSDISTFSKTTPKQSLQFANHSTPSPKNYKPVIRSPAKKPFIPVTGRLHIPPEAFSPEMKRYFDRVSACVKGYLTRRLIKTEKVQEIIKTIQDTKQFAYKFQAETPIKQGQFSNQDRYLLDRIIAQLQSALLDIHEVFFVIPVWERMSLISQSRQLWEEKRLRESNATRSSVSSSQPRISSATLKAMERKRRAQEAEVAVFGDNRPKSAPPCEASQRKSQQSIDLSGPIRRHYQFLFTRALRPLSGHGVTSQSGNISAREKPRPHTALGTSTKQQATIKVKKTTATGKTTTKPSTARVSKVTTTKPKSKVSGAWR